MKHTLLTFFLVLILVPVFAQTKESNGPDFDSIKLAIQDETAPYYYPRLMERLQALDSSLTAADFSHLYFGYFFQKEYKPYVPIPEEDKIKEFSGRTNLTIESYDSIITIGVKYLKKFPFNVNIINYVAYAYNKKGNSRMASKLMRQSQYILMTIMSSGDGLTKETAYHVLTVGNEYDLLRFMNLKLESQALTGNYDYLELKANSDKIKGLYFNIEKMINTLSSSSSSN